MSQKPQAVQAIAILTCAGEAPAAVCVPATLCLNPNAPNTGAPPATILDGTPLGPGTALDPVPNPAKYPFNTLQSDAGFVSDLHISNFFGTATATETGSVLIKNFRPPDVVVPVNSNVLLTYDVYAEFLITAQGVWAGPLFTVDPTTVAVTVNLIGSPGGFGTSALAFNTPGNGQYGVAVHGASDFLLGTATLSSLLGVTPASASGCTLTPGTSCSTASTNFDAVLNYTPQPGTTGPTGFMQNVNLTNLTIGAAGQTTPPETTETINANGSVDFVTGVLFGSPSGVATLTYALAVIPEPASLTLLGAGLLGMGFALRRRRNRASRT